MSDVCGAGSCHRPEVAGAEGERVQCSRHGTLGQTHGLRGATGGSARGRNMSIRRTLVFAFPRNMCLCGDEGYPSVQPAALD